MNTMLDDGVMELMTARRELDKAHKAACAAMARFQSVKCADIMSADERIAARSLLDQTVPLCTAILAALQAVPNVASALRAEEPLAHRANSTLPPMRTAKSMLDVFKAKKREGVVAASARYGRPIAALVGCLLLCLVCNVEAASTIPADVHAVAWTLYAEARGEGAKGLQAVATVIANRSAERGLSPAQVVRQPYQFECWNGRRIAGTGRGPTWAQCRNLAARICDGTFQASEAWNHFFNPRKASPRWALAMNDRTRIGAHVFGTIN